MFEWMFDVADKMMVSRNMGKWTYRIFKWKSQISWLSYSVVDTGLPVPTPVSVHVAGF